jgi:ribonuclease HII
MRASPNSRIEGTLRRQGYHHIAGVDEVGRGCLFGPVVAAAVILDPERPIRGLNDSKLLEPKRREVLSRRIRERAISVAVEASDSAQIDRVNIYQASRLAMRDAVLSLSIAADYLLVDAMRIDLDLPQRALIRGDSRCSSIAAASIVAKVERDRWMKIWDEVYPQYGLASNKGYGAPVHLQALKEFGVTPLHRHSFRPVAEAALFSAELPPGENCVQLPHFPKPEAATL